MQRTILFLFFCLFISSSSNGQANQSPKIEIQIACGWGGFYSTEIDSIHKYVSNKNYALIKHKLFSQSKIEAVLSLIALRELQLKHLVVLSFEEQTQINKISSWKDKYSVCYTCTGNFEGTVRMLLANVNNQVYVLIKESVFKSN